MKEAIFPDLKKSRFLLVGINYISDGQAVRPGI